MDRMLDRWDRDWVVYRGETVPCPGCHPKRGTLPAAAARTTPTSYPRPWPPLAVAGAGLPGDHGSRKPCVGSGADAQEGWGGRRAPHKARGARRRRAGGGRRRLQGRVATRCRRQVGGPGKGAGGPGGGRGRRERLRTTRRRSHPLWLGPTLGRAKEREAKRLRGGDRLVPVATGACRDWLPRTNHS